MRQTIIGFFNNEAEAGYALDKLRAAGISDADIDFTGNNSIERSLADTTPQGNESPYEVGDESRYPETTSGSLNDENILNEDTIRDRKGFDYEEGKGDSIGRFFRNLFDNKEDAERFAEIGRKTCIVSVHAESALEAERARDILDESGAVEVDNELQTGATTSDIAASQSDVSPTGTTRLRSHIVGRTVNEEYRLRGRSTRPGQPDQPQKRNMNSPSGESPSGETNLSDEAGAKSTFPEREI